MSNRRRHEEVRARDRIIDRAVELSRPSGAPSVGTAPNGVTSITSPGALPGATWPDADGNTVRIAMTDIDMTDDSQAMTAPSTPKV